MEFVLITQKKCEQKNYLNILSSSVKVHVDTSFFVNLNLLRFETVTVKSKMSPGSGCVALRQGQSSFKSFFLWKKIDKSLKIIICFKMVYDQFYFLKSCSTTSTKVHLNAFSFIENEKPCIILWIFLHQPYYSTSFPFSTWK